jgi:molybdate transport system ATP-binding protein
LQQALIAQLAHSENLINVALPEPDAPAARHDLARDRRVFYVAQKLLTLCFY